MSVKYPISIKDLYNNAHLLDEEDFKDWIIANLENENHLILEI